MDDNLIYELKKLAGSILDRKDFNDVVLLKKELMEMYERLIILEYRKNTIKEEPKIPKIEDTPPTAEQPEEPIKGEAEIKEFFEPVFDSVVDDMKQKKEFEDTIPIEETEKLFESTSTQGKQRSLHDKLLSKSIQVGLNDRIAFVNKLFNFDQGAFNEVLRNLNNFETRQQAIEYIEIQVKPKYDWEGKDEMVERFMALIDRKFV